MQLEMQREVEERKKQKKEEEAKQRIDYIEKMKQATIIDEIDDKPAKKCELDFHGFLPRTYLFIFGIVIIIHNTLNWVCSVLRRTAGPMGIERVYFIGAEFVCGNFSQGRWV